MSSFFGELKRRNVVRVGIAYAIVAWLVTEVSSVAFPALHLPDWTLTLIVVLTALGFPFALLFAWAYELTPEGLKRTHEVPVEASVTPATGRKLDFMIIGVMAAALIYFISNHDWGGERAEPEQVAVSNVVHKSIAVLPFANLSPDEENAFFASGVHEDILTYLSKVQDLRVIARTSVLKYTGAGIDLRDVADELGVAHIVEGSVRRAGNRVRITAQLVDGKTQEHLWAENYDRELTDVFEIQTDVAKEIVAALEANLTEEEQLVLETRPTDSVEAYDLFLKARERLTKGEYTAEMFQDAEPLLVKAVEIDPEFALAWTMLADVHGAAYWYPYDRTDERKQKARDAIDRAMNLQPDLPEAQASLGEFYYRAFSNFERSLEHLEIAHQRMPGNATILRQMGLCQRRLNQWDESVESFEKAIVLDPGDLSITYVLVETLWSMRSWDKANAILDAAIAKYDDDENFRVQQTLIHLDETGDLAPAEELLNELEPIPSFDYSFLKFTVPLGRRDFEGALAAIESQKDVFSAAPGLVELFRGEIYLGMKDTGVARREFETARQATREAIADRSEDDGYIVGPLYSRLSLIEAYLGDAESALEAVSRGEKLYPESADSLEGAFQSAVRAKTLAVLGETDAALDEIERLLTIPAGFTRWSLTLDPTWDFMRDNERFVALTTPDGVVTR